MQSVYHTMNQEFTKLVLLGYMGSGKSTVAAALGRKLGVPAMDLDDHIVEKEGLSINEIFKSKGEIHFRLLESICLQQLLSSEKSFVLALGGGTPCYANNMDHIAASQASSIYLRGSLDTLCERLRGEKSHRPLISSLDDVQLSDFIAKHLFERRDFYERADHIVSIDGRSVEAIVAAILKKI